MSHILVCGGLILDITFVMPEWVTPQSIVQVNRAMQGPGGKGINQAVAARRLGTDVSILGCVGQDIVGTILIDSLAQEHVNTDLVVRHPSLGTGVVGILLYGHDPAYVAYKGASMALSASDALHAEAHITPDSVVLVSFEVPQDAVEAVLRIAKEKGATTVLNPAPLEFDPATINYWPLVDFLIPNIREAQGILASGADAQDLLQPLLAKGVGAVCITHGEYGCYFANRTETHHEPAIPIQAVDTTGASDAFCAAFALAVTERQSIRDTLRFASIAAGLPTQAGRGT